MSKKKVFDGIMQGAKEALEYAKNDVFELTEMDIIPDDKPNIMFVPHSIRLNEKELKRLFKFVKKNPARVYAVWNTNDNGIGVNTYVSDTVTTKDITDYDCW